MTTAPAKPKVDLFFSYAHGDAPRAHRFLRELKEHTDVDSRFDIAFKHDLNIAPGDQWESILHSWLDKVHGGIFCISPKFLKSSFCMDVELRKLLDSKKLLFPILLNRADWDRTRFGVLSSLQVLGDNPPLNNIPYWTAKDREDFSFRAFQKLHDKLRKHHGI